MNITNIPNYSKATSGLRQSQTIQNQQFKLIYVYPMLIAQKLDQNILMTLRKFITHSYLREIIVSNSLNIISVASQLQAPAQQSGEVARLIGQAIIGGSNNQNIQPNTQLLTQPQDTYIYQQQVQQKTNVIKKHLETDIRTKKLLPQVELITLNNLIDVPVIAGTAPNQINDLALLFILSIALVRNITLDKFQNIQAIIRLLKNTPEEDWYKLLTYMTSVNKPARERIADTIREYMPRSATRRSVMWILTKIEGSDPSSKKTEQRNLSTDDSERQAASNHILDLIASIKRSELDNVEMNFSFVLNPTVLKNRTGIDISNNTLEKTIVRINPRQEQILHQMIDKFIELTATAGSAILSSVTNALYPVSSHSVDRDTLEDLERLEARGNLNPGERTQLNQLRSTSPPAADLNLNFLELRDIHFGEKLNNHIQRAVLDTIRTEFNSSLGSMSPNEAQTRIKLVKALCQSMEQVDSVLSENLKKIQDNALLSTNFNEYEFERFTKQTYNASTTLASYNHRFERSISQLLNRGNLIFSAIKPLIYSAVEDFIRAIVVRHNYHSNMSAVLGYDQKSVMTKFVPQIKDMIFAVFYFFFLYRFQSAICQFMDILDVEVEAAVGDAMDFPNYCLIIPLHVILAMYTASVTNNFGQFMSGGGKGGSINDLNTFNDNYVKGMIRQICMRLKVPSIIVIDDRSSSIFFKFQFMTTVEKMNLGTVDSFVKSKLQ